MPEEELTDPSDQIAVGCPADRGNTFTVTGRGGIPDHPSQYLRGRAVWQDTRNLPQANHSTLPTINQEPSTSNTKLRSDIVVETDGGRGDGEKMNVLRQNATRYNNQPLIEAQGWMIDEHGTIILTADPNTVRQPNSWTSSQSCR